ncbi:thioesterase [Planomonospora sp. ID91781]|uniref:thioesterase II family protein n=1 Tax=Planomonospora sp. ID91781 TaxID=2738135 RepID=UPI0018C41B6F|nr:thioesterase [Planomonospora sp. ID91781]MBG0823063.1 thioesterase [Planomonospora sp. ID91781]
MAIEPLSITRPTPPPTPQPDPPAGPAPALLCLPYAGGAAGAYHGLRGACGAVEVVAVQLPGRENRIAEPPEFSVPRLTDEIAPHTARPYALYGHSMGARIAFEVARELRRRGLPPPLRLYAGAAHPPDRRVPLAATADLPDEAFIDQLVRRAGAPEELRDVPELRELLLPVLRADFTWIKRYRYAPEPPLDVPVVAFAGLGDAEVPPGDMLGWARHTRAGFALRTLRGGHLFVRDGSAELARLITADLAGPGPGRGTDPPPVQDDEIHVRVFPAGEPPGTPGAGAGGPSRAVDRAGGLAVEVTVRGGAVGAAVGLPAAYGAARDAARDAFPGAAHGPVHGASPGAGRGGGSGDGPGDGLGPGEREQLADAAEEDRPWLELRARTARRALSRAGAHAQAAAGFPDLAAPGPWPADAGWQVTFLPLHTPLGEALAAVAEPRGRTRLSADVWTDR